MLIKLKWMSELLEQIQSESEHNRKVWSKSGFQFSQVDVCDWREVFGFGQRHLVDRLMRVIPVCVCVCVRRRGRNVYLVWLRKGTSGGRPGRRLHSRGGELG